MATHMTSREFNQDTSRAKKAAEHGPVFITDRGRTAHVIDRLAEPVGVEDITLELPVSPERAQPASLSGSRSAASSRKWW